VTHHTPEHPGGVRNKRGEGGGREEGGRKSKVRGKEEKEGEKECGERAEKEKEWEGKVFVDIM